MDIQNDPEYKRVEIRKIQALTGERSLTLVFPKQFARELGIVKGDFLKCCVEDNRLILEKMIPVMKPFDDRFPKKGTSSLVTLKSMKKIKLWVMLLRIIFKRVPIHDLIRNLNLLLGDGI